MLAALVLVAAVTATAANGPAKSKRPARSGVLDFRDQSVGTSLTECPQAGRGSDTQAKPLDRRQVDQAEKASGGGDDRRANQDYSCFAQDETSVDVNPTQPRNAVVGANDYRSTSAQPGFYATTDSGEHWYDGNLPIPSVPGGDVLDSGGDPAVAYDRQGIAYYASINFNRHDDDNGVFLSRSTNGGFTWSRACVPIDTTPEDGSDDEGVCGGPGDARQPGDGTIAFQKDDNAEPDFSVPFHDKEYIAAGPRPAGVEAVCFSPFQKTPGPCAEGAVGVDRIYYTWTVYTATTGAVNFSYSDDRGHSWSAPKEISGHAPFCIGLGDPDACDNSSFAVPSVNPTTGALYVAFESNNAQEENQYLLVRSHDGGATFQGPFFVTPVYDVNYPLAGEERPDCTDRGQSAGSAVLTNSCFRLGAGGNVVVDQRGGAFADDLYLVLSDNRNGTRLSTNTDVFLFKSANGGATWTGPTRVNDDPSRASGNRDCTGGPGCAAARGNDQWFPWVDIGPRGDLSVAFYDRRLDTASTANEWPGSRQRPGNYLVWRFAAGCTVRQADSRECVAPEAQTMPQPAGPVNPGSGPQPGSVQSSFPLRNVTLSDNPSNWDYSFRAGIFAGDYDGLAIGPDNRAWAPWTDARNGRSSREQAGRNPICEQSDVFVDLFGAPAEGGVAKAKDTDSLFLVTPCPPEARDKKSR